jgi:hypothetical protein
MTYRGARKELLPHRSRHGDIVEFWFQTGIPSSAFELVTAAGAEYGVGCVGQKTINDASSTCRLCVTAKNGTSRMPLACASGVAELLPATVYKVSILIAENITATVTRDTNNNAEPVARVSMPLASASVQGDLRLVLPPGPGFVCVRQIRVSNPQLCPSLPSLAFAASNASCCSSSCSDLSTACSCACPATMLPTNHTCGQLYFMDLCAFVCVFFLRFG